MSPISDPPEYSETHSSQSIERGRLALSVVIPVLNGQDTIAQLLRSLFRQSFSQDWEIVVADNGSTDATRGVVESLQSTHTQLRIVDANGQQNASYARNRGAEVAKGRNLLFLDADDEVNADYLEAMYGALEDHEIVAARLDGLSIESPWRPQTPDIVSGSPALGFLPAAGAGTLGIWRDVFEAVGGFDTSIRWGEDVDLSWRLQLMGYEIAFIDRAIVRYRPPASAKAAYRQARARGFARVVLYSRYRHYGMPRMPAYQVPRYYLAPFVHLGRSRSKRDLARCLQLFGTRIGVIEACIRLRIVYS